MSLHARTPWGSRARAQRSSLAAIAATTLVMSFTLSAIIGWGWRSPVVAVTDTLRAISAAEGSVVVTEDLASDSAAQDARVRKTIATTFRPAPIDIARAVVDGPWPVARAGSDASVLFVRSSGALEGDIRTVKGSFGPLPLNDAAIDSAGASVLRVTVGDIIHVMLNSGDAALRIVAVWEQRHPSSLTLASLPAGVDGTTARLIVGEATVAAGASTPKSTWTIAPSTGRVTPADLDPLAYGFSHLESAVSRAQSQDAAAPTVTGPGARPIAAMQRSIAAVGEVLPVPITVLSISAIVAFALLAILLASSRATETRLLRARGASLSTFVLVGAVEALAVALPGAVIGAFAAQALLLVALGPPTNAVETLIAPLAAIVTAVAVTTVVGVVFAAEPARSGAGAESGRTRTTVFLSAAVLIVAIAGVTLWRFLLYGVPAPGQRADPSGVLAPAALLSAIAVLGLLLLTPLTAVFERRSTRTIGLDRVLPARQLRRNTVVFAAPVALLILAIGGSTLAAGYSATWTTFLAGSSKLVNGSDIRLAFGGLATVSDPSVLIDRAPYARLPGARSVTPVLRTDARAGDYTLSVIGIAADRLAALAPVGSSVTDPRMLAAAIRPGESALKGVMLPSGARQFSLTMSAVRADDQTSPLLAGASAFATAWFADGLGDIFPTTLDSIPVTAKSAGSPSTVRATIPRGGPWMLVALDVGVHAPATLRGLEVRVTSLDAGGPLPLPAGQQWVPQPAVFDAGAKALGGTDVMAFSRASVSASEVDRSLVRLMPRGTATVPVVISRSMASIANLAPGDTADVDGTWASFHIRVAAITTMVPGLTGTPALLADLPSLENSMLRTSQQLPAVDELWMSSATPESVAAAAGRLAGPSATVSTSAASLEGRFMTAAVVGLWIGAVGSAVFAIIALAAALAVFTRHRVGEVSVLRAFGIAAPDQVRMRRLEILLITGYSAIVGLVGGAVVSALTVTTLTRLSSSVAAQSLPIGLRVDVGWLALVVAAIAAATALVVSRVARSTRTNAVGARR